MNLFVHLPSLFYMISKHSNSCLVGGGGVGNLGNHSYITYKY